MLFCFTNIYTDILKGNSSWKFGVAVLHHMYAVCQEKLQFFCPQKYSYFAQKKILVKLTQAAQSFSLLGCKLSKKAIFFFNLIFYSNSIFAQIQFHSHLSFCNFFRKANNLHLLKSCFLKSISEQSKPIKSVVLNRWVAGTYCWSQ